jgi:hypothetical protein
MKNEKLFKILAIVGKVKSNSWNDVRKIVDIMPSVKIKQKKWVDEFKIKHPDIYPLDLSKTQTWSTYDGECINLVFSNKENKIICEVSIYEGDNMRGYRTNLRFTATLVMPDSFIKELEKKILYALDQFAEDAYEEYLESKKKLWLLNFKSKITS